MGRSRCSTVQTRGRFYHHLHNNPKFQLIELKKNKTKTLLLLIMKMNFTFCVTVLFDVEYGGILFNHDVSNDFSLEVGPFRKLATGNG